MGTIGVRSGVDVQSLYPASGAFIYGRGSETTNVQQGSNGYRPALWTFNASAYNSIYSDSVTTVQPSANQALMIIRA